MRDPHEVFISMHDADALGALRRDLRSNGSTEARVAKQLDALLRETGIVAHEVLAPDRIALGSTVTYVEEPAGVRRTVTLSYPEEADVDGRISVLSPVGLALLGRRPGSRVMTHTADGWPLDIRIVGVNRRTTRTRPATERRAAYAS